MGERGRKNCPGCNKLVGVASRRCQYCGHEFKPAAKPVDPKPKLTCTKETQEETRSVRTGRELRIVAPAGEPPVKFNGDVIDWGHKVQEAGLAQSRFYTASALKYWLANYFVNRNLPEFTELSEQIDREFSQT